MPQRLPLAALLLALCSTLGAVQAAERPQQLASPDQVPTGLAKSDWSSIRAAYEAGRHAFQPAEGGWQARNPGQQWLTKFDGRGFIAEPKSGDWKWGLELKSYGFAGHEQSISGKPAVKAAGQRLTYAWDDTVQEWFVNDQRGLEHGFTLSKRPAEIIAPQTGLLSFTLGIRGGLHPQITTDSQGVQFRDAQGAIVLTYAGLKVWDADGKVLPSQFEAAEAGVRLLVDERDARYPIIIDPIAQQAYLKASNTGTGDYFGCSVAVSGDTVVVGAFQEDSSTTGVNSTPDEGAVDAGAAYVFVRSGGVWSQQAYLKASNTGAVDWFGISVAVSGDTVVVGAHREDSSTTGVNSSTNEGAVDSGAAYVFVRSGGVWSQEAYLKASNTGAVDWFGVDVGISGDTVVVGASLENSSTTGVNSTPNDDAVDSGAAYVFVRSGTVWAQQAYLKASNTGAYDRFGECVSVSADTVVVGAPYEDSSTTGVNSPPNDNSTDAGAAYVFVRSGTVWAQHAYLKASNTGANDEFGLCVSVSGDTLVVGARREDSSTTGVNSTPNDGALDSGAAYVFVRSGTVWTQQAYIKASNTGADDWFGVDVGISGDTVVVGAYGEDSSTTGVNSTPDGGAVDSGAAYVFVRSGTVWAQQAYLKASNTGAGDLFGRLVSVSGDTVVVGAYVEDSSSMGVNGPANENASAAGAAYIFTGLGTGQSGTTFTTTGSTSGNRPWNRPEHNDALPPFALSASATAVPYEAVSFTVNTTGAYTLKSTGTNPAGWDNYLFLYSAAFDPSAPLSNVLIGNDDNPGVGEAAFAYHLNAGTTYFLITTGYGNNHFGDYSIEITGPGAVTVLNSFAEQRLIGGTGLPTGIHQRTPYNATLPNVTFLDTGSSGQPIVGCAPLALARNTFWHSGISPLSNLSGFQSLINTLHSQGNAYGMISYRNPNLTQGPSDLKMKRLSLLRGNVVHNDRRLLSPSDESDERKRVSDIYRWVKSMIDRGYPVLVVSGVTEGREHAFMIDGYRKVNPWFGSEDLYFHFLWGFPPSVSNPDTVSDASWMRIDESQGFGFFNIDNFDALDPTVSEQFGDWAATDAEELVFFAVSPPPSPSKTFRCGARFDFEFVTSNITMPVAGYGTLDDPFLSFGSPAFWQDKDRLDFIAKPASFNDGDVAQIGEMIFSNSDTDEDDTARIDATLNVHATFGDGLVSVTPMPLKIKPGTGAGTQIIDGPDVSLIQTVPVNGKSYHFKIWLGTATSVTPEVSVAQGTSKTTAVWAQLLEATQKAQIISPANGSALTSTELPLEWNAGLGVTRYDLYVGTTVGGKEIYSGNQGTALSRTVTVPATGGKIYVTLWSQIKGAWQSNTYVYTAQAPEKAVLLSWGDGMSLSDGNLMLEWTAGVGVSKYSIYVGSTVGGRDIATRNVSAPTTTQSIPVPTDGGPIYITLWSYINGAWQSESYWATTALPTSGSTPATLYHPYNASTLDDTSVEFYWDEGVNVTARQLWVGSTPDGYDLFKGGNESGFSRTLNLPGDGRRIYVTLHSKIGSGSTWNSNGYYFTAVTSPPPQAAELWSPANGATLTSPSLNLNWDAVTGATRYDVYVGNTPMGSDIFKGNMGTGTSKTVVVPSDGRPVYATLWSQISNKWFQNTYWFTTASLASGNLKAVMLQPENGSELPGTTATFDWDTGTGVTSYSLYVGTTPGGKELYSATSSTIRSRTLTTLPTDGRKIYVTLWSKIGTAWQSNSYLYTAANITGVKAEMTSPAPDSVFESAVVTFEWDAGVGATQYWLQIGRTPGSSNIYAGNQGTSLTRTLTTMPTDGSPIYVKLQSFINGVWQTNEYIYQAALPP